MKSQEINIGTLKKFGLLILIGAVLGAPRISTSQTQSWNPGGDHTSIKPANRWSFSHPSPRLSSEQGLNFQIGKSIFEKIWVFAPASTTSSDGLGPLYNARSCSRCHTRNGRGMIESGKSSSPALFLRLSIEPTLADEKQIEQRKKLGVIPEPTYGKQLQTFAYPGGVAEAKLETTYTAKLVKLSPDKATSIFKPSYHIKAQGYGKFHNDLRTSPRIAPPMIGLGLIESIETEDILAWEDPNDTNNDGISGRSNQVSDAVTGKTVLGRFGWKAGHPSLDQQNNAAFNGDIGLSSWMFPNHAGDCTHKQTKCLEQIHGNRNRLGEDTDTPEISKELSDLVLFYTRFIAVPGRRIEEAQKVEKGEQLFHAAACHKCHRPNYITSKHAQEPTLRNQNIWPYSDFLLHDMGEGLADNRQEFLADGREWKTPPLWGLGLTKTVGDGEFYLHDGRARSLLEAILWHGGEAESSRDYFVQFSDSEKTALITFLESL